MILDLANICRCWRLASRQRSQTWKPGSGRAGFCFWGRVLAAWVGPVDSGKGRLPGSALEQISVDRRFAGKLRPAPAAFYACVLISAV